MKKLFYLFALISFSVFAQRPALNVKQPLSDYVYSGEGWAISAADNQALSSTGSYSQPSTTTSATGQNWVTGTPPTITAGFAVNAGFLICPPGRMMRVKSFDFSADNTCSVQVWKHERQIKDLLNGNSPILLGGMFSTYTGFIPSGGGMFTKDLDDLILFPGQRLQATYTRNTTTGVNWTFNYIGEDLTFDTNFTAAKTMLLIGDSIGLVAEEGALTSALWPFAIRDKYIAAGKDVRLVNLCRGGTNTQNWDWLVRNGRIDGIKADILFINLGMNDAASTTGLSSSTGYTKTGLKNIVARYLSKNLSGKVVINSITPTDKSPNATNVAAYRSEIAAAVTEMQALGQAVYFADTNTASLTITDANFVEQGSGNHLHPNTTGQAFMIPVIWAVCQNLL